MGSIRRQLFRLLLGVGLPLVVLEVWNAAEHYRHQVERAQVSVMEMANTTAAATAELLALTRRSLEAVVMTLEGEPGAWDDEAACESVVLPAAGALPYVTNLGLLDPEGFMVCATSPPQEPPVTSAMDREWFRRVLATGAPVTSPPQRGRIMGRWVVVLAQPVADERGEIRGVLVGSLALASFQDLLATVDLPQAALVTIFDRHNVVLARSRDFEGWVGRTIDSEGVVQDSIQPGVAITRTVDAEGTPSTFARVDVPSTDWRIFAGLPDAIVYGPARRAATRDLSITIPLLLLAIILGAGFYSQVSGALGRLVRDVDRAGMGDSIPEEGPEEVRAVAQALNRTLEARARAEDAERQAKERYRSILENAVFGIYLSTPDGTLREANPALATLLGYPSPHALRRAGMENVYANPRDRTRLVEKHLTTGEPIRDIELDWLRLDGSGVKVRLNGKVVDGPGGEPLFEVIVEDITEQRAMETEYRHTQKMEAVGRLAGGVAHDVNNVLTAILGHSALLKRRLDEESEARSDAEGVIEAARRGAALTRQLLAFSRKEVTQPRLMDLSGAVEDIRVMVERLLGEDVKLVTRLDADLPPVKADPGQVEQVLINLLVNARDALPRGGRIEVTTTLQPARASEAAAAPRGWVRLEVRDAGTGMTPEVRERIFEPFFTTKPAGEGTGLGLATVYAIVTNGGGRIAVESEPGAGTTFVLLFPAAERTAPVERARVATPRPGRSGGRILVAEDEPSVREVVCRVLERGGYEVVATADGKEALAAARALDGGVDLFLTDVVMPGMNGLEAADALLRERPGLPVLFMSGYNESEALRSRTREDPGVFISKPFAPEELLERVRERLDAATSSAPAPAD